MDLPALAPCISPLRTCRLTLHPEAILPPEHVQEAIWPLCSARYYSCISTGCIAATRICRHPLPVLVMASWHFYLQIGIQAEPTLASAPARGSEKIQDGIDPQAVLTNLDRNSSRSCLLDLASLLGHRRLLPKRHARSEQDVPRALATLLQAASGLSSAGPFRECCLMRSSGAHRSGNQIATVGDALNRP